MTEIQIYIVCFEILRWFKAYNERVQQHEVVTLRQVVIPWFKDLEGFSRFLGFQKKYLFWSRMFNESAPFHFQLLKRSRVA